MFLLRAIKRLLPGAAFAEADNGLVAVAAVTAEPARYDVVLLVSATGQLVRGKRARGSTALPPSPLACAQDKEMPVMDGHGTCEALRALRFQGLVVGISGNSAPEDGRLRGARRGGLQGQAGVSGGPI